MRRMPHGRMRPKEMERVMLLLVMVVVVLLLAAKETIQPEWVVRHIHTLSHTENGTEDDAKGAGRWLPAK